MLAILQEPNLIDQSVDMHCVPSESSSGNHCVDVLTMVKQAEQTASNISKARSTSSWCRLLHGMFFSEVPISIVKFGRKDVAIDIGFP